MPPLHLPREYYLQRAVTCYERAGDLRSAADVLAGFGSPAASADAARRYVALGDLAAAGEAYLAAEQPRAALDCFTQARLPERALVCLQQLDDPAGAGALLLELGRLAEAVPLLERALALAPTRTAQVPLRLQLAHALGVTVGEAHYRTALAQLPQLPTTVASAEAWVALGAWGAAVGRQDRMQEGHAHALRLLEAADAWPRWREVATRYRAAAQVIGNRRLVQILTAQLAEHAEEAQPTTPLPDPAQRLLDTGQWEEALAVLEPRARSSDETAKALVATLVEGDRLPSPREGEGLGVRGSREKAIPSLALRLQAAALLGEVGDPRLLDPQRGDAPLGGYWCPIDAGPFWFDDDRQGALRQVTMRYAYRIARYPVTNVEYRRFVEAGGYQERQWWTEQGWTYLQPGGYRWSGEPERITLPRFWDDAARNQPTQPVVGVTWWECAAYCAWLTATGRAAGWLPVGDEIRLPTSLEWERVARGIDQRRYPWGDEPPNAERANYQATEIERATPVGCFPAGAAPCGALDVAGNVREWLATPHAEPELAEARKDFTPNAWVLLSNGWYNSQIEYLCCGARSRDYPNFRGSNDAFRSVWSRALLV